MRAVVAFLGPHPEEPSEVRAVEHQGSSSTSRRCSANEHTTMRKPLVVRNYGSQKQLE